MRRALIRLAVFLIAALAAVFLGHRVNAATITVTLEFDRFDVGATAGCSLREAIQSANNNALFAGCEASGAFGDDVIVFDDNVVTVFITRTVSGGNNDNADGDLDVYVGFDNRLTIRGPITVLVQDVFDRAFDVYSDGSDRGVFELERVTVQGGDLRLGLTVDNPTVSSAQIECVFGGGGIRVNHGVRAELIDSIVRSNTAAYAGGGVCVQEGASLVLTGTQVLSNTVGLSGTERVSWAAGGGGIWSSSDLQIENSALLHNRVVLSGGFYGLAGGGGIGLITGNLTVVNSEVSHNQVEQGAAAEAQGGGIMAARWDDSQGTLGTVSLQDVRVLHNRSVGGKFAYGGGIALVQGVQAIMFRFSITGNVIANNVLSATEGALGGGLAVGLSYQPSGYLPPKVTMVRGSISDNTATVIAPSVEDQVTPTVFGGGVFFGFGSEFTLTLAYVGKNEASYSGPSITDTNGFGGGISAYYATGQLNRVTVDSNSLRNFRFGGGAGLQTAGGQLVVRNSVFTGNRGSSSPATDAGTLGGGAYIGFGSVADVEGSLFSGNSVAGTLFGSGGGLGVDGTLFITRTTVSENEAHQGGGFGGTPSLLQAYQITITENIASHPVYAEGGAWAGAGRVFVRESLIARNRTNAPSGSAGAIVRYGGEFHLEDSIVVSNRVPATWFANGGALLNGANSTVWITSSQVLSNVAQAVSGDAYVGGMNNGDPSGELRLYRVELAFNQTVGSNDASGGAIGNSGIAVVVESTVRDNHVSRTDDTPSGGGAGVSNGGRLRVERSAIVANRAAYASGVSTYGNAETHLLNTTVSGNGPADSQTIQGVALTGTAYLTHTTIASNTGLGLVVEGGDAAFYGVLLAYHPSGNCAAWGVSGNALHSLSSDGTCGNHSFVLNQDPLLQPLALNGGNTLNHALPVGSAALSRVAPCGASDDQRGVARPAVCDVGAYERHEEVSLSITKRPAAGNAIVGLPFTYTLEITNGGPDVALNVVVTDSLVGDAVYHALVAATQASALTYTFNSSGAVFTVTRIAPGAVFSIVYTVVPSASGVFSNTASVQASVGQSDPDLGDNTANAGSVFAQANADLELSKRAHPSVVRPNGVVTYTLVVTNNGPSAAQGITLVDTIAGAIFGGVVGSTPGVNVTVLGNQLTATIASLASGEAFTVVYTVTAPSTGGVVISNTAVVTTPDDLSQGNNVPPGGSVQTPVAAQVDLAVQKTAASTTAVAGVPFTYTLVITNRGPDSALEVIVTDTLVGGATYGSVIAATDQASLTHTFSGANAVFTITNIAPGTVFTIVYNVFPPTNGGVFTNTAGVSSAASNETNPGDEVSPPVSVLGQASADLEIAKTASPSTVLASGVITYTLVVTNRGPSAAAEVTVTDVVSGTVIGGVVGATSGVNWVWSGNVLTFTVGTLGAGNSVTMVYTVTAPSSGGVVTNSVVVTSAVGDPDLSNNVPPGGSVGTPVQAVADLEVSKRAEPGVAIAGDVITYTLVVTNRGPSAATEVTVTDVVSGTTIGGVVGATPGVNWSWSGNVLTFTIGTLSAGNSVTMVYTVTAPSSGGVVTNSVVVTSAVDDPDLSNNTPPGGGVSTPIAQQATLTATKTQTYQLGVGGRVLYGGLITYTLRVTNTSAVTATGVVLTDSLSSSVVFVSASPACALTGNQVVCSLGTLAPGEVTTVNLVVRAGASGAVVTNSALVGAANASVVSTNSVTARIENRLWAPIVRRQ